MPYDKSLQIKAQKLYESGKTHKEIAQTIGTVSPYTVKYWSNKGKWEKGKLVPKITAKEEEGILETAKAVGLTKKRVIQKILEFQEATQEVGKGKNKKLKPIYYTQTEGNRQAIEILGLKKEHLNLNIEASNTFSDLLERAAGWK